MNKDEERFWSELLTLLDKWDVEVTAEDRYPGWPECGEDIQINFYSATIYDKATSDIVRDIINIDCGSFISPRSEKGLADEPTTPNTDDV